MFKFVHDTSYRILYQLLRQTRFYGVCKPDEPHDPETKITVLPNGVKVATETTTSPLVCISLFIEAGSRFESACNNGVTHFIEHMAYKGFTNISQTELEESLRSMGSKMTAQTLRELQIFSATCTLECTSYVINILSRIFIDLNLNDSSIESAKQNVYLEMIDAENNPKMVVFDYLHQTAFQGTPLAQCVIGPTQNLGLFDKNFISSFMSKHYQPFKFCLAVSGCVRHEDVMQHAEASFGHMHQKSDSKSEGGPCRFTGSEITYRDDSMPFAHVAIAFEVPGYRHADYLTLLLMTSMVGSWDRSQGGGINNGLPLARAAAHDLCEKYEAFYIPYRDVGLWGIYYVGKLMELDDMLGNIQNQWMHMCTTIRANDVQRSLNLAKLKIAKGMDGVINSSYDIGLQLMYSRKRRSVTDLFDELSKIKAHNVKSACDSYLYDRCPAVAAIGPIETLPDYTRIKAGQYWLRL